MSTQYKAKFQVSGTVIKVGEVQTFASGFQKREIVIETNPKYPSPVAVTLTKGDCEKGDGLAVGMAVEVEGFVNGRKWDGPNGTKYFTDLSVKSIVTAGGEATPAPKAAKAIEPEVVDDDDALPF